MHLLDISADALRAVLQHLEPKDLCSCKRVCRKLGALAREVQRNFMVCAGMHVSTYVKRSVTWTA